MNVQETSSGPPRLKGKDMLPNHRSPILYQNTEQTITIIDIPTSIIHAQGIPLGSCNRTLLSCEPLQEPYQSTEPRSQKTREKLINSFRHEHNEELDALYTNLIHSAIEDLQRRNIEAWCLSRKGSMWIESRKRKASPISTANVDGAADAATSKADQSELDCSSNDEALLSHVLEDIVNQRTSSLDICIDKSEIIHSWDGSFHNHEDTPIEMTIQQINFTIPEKSTFLLGDCTRPSEFRNTLRSLSSDYNLKRHFNFILLDPPWPNSSVKRKSAYSVENMLRDAKKMLLGMDLDQYVAENGLLGVWITNKPAIRNLVLGAGGLFETWNVGLIEEWVWVKTTAYGEPVTAINGLWRKPYEILLLGRGPPSRLETAQHSDSVHRRVMFGVPDLHSRKPCLKTLIEPLLPERYQALEMFARYLVAGWWSWGNEVLKFNWDGHWGKRDEEDERPLMSLS